VVGVDLDDHDPLLGPVVVAKHPRLGHVGQAGLLERVLGGKPLHGVTDRVTNEVDRHDEVVFFHREIADDFAVVALVRLPVGGDQRKKGSAAAATKSSAR
jgi:hypothetical protein